MPTVVVYFFDKKHVHVPVFEIVDSDETPKPTVEIPTATLVPATSSPLDSFRGRLKSVIKDKRLRAID